MVDLINDRNAEFTHLALSWQSSSGSWVVLAAGLSREDIQQRVDRWVSKGQFRENFRIYEVAEAEPMVKACPKCGVRYANSCHHDGDPVPAVFMPASHSLALLEGTVENARGKLDSFRVEYNEVKGLVTKDD